MRKKLFLSIIFAAFGLVSAGQFALAALCLFAPWQFFEVSVKNYAAGAELLTRYFLTEIQPKLFPGQSWLQRALNDDAFVNNNSVELPHSGTIPAITVNRSSWPASASQRTDAATNYLLEELSSDPVHIQDSEALTVAYDKRASVLTHLANSINAKAGNRALYKWAAGASGARVIKSTGAARAAAGPSQTGNRNAFTLNDIIKVRQMFFQDDVITENADLMGIAILTPTQLADLLAQSNILEAQKYGRANFPSGVFDRALGFDIYVRSSVVVYSNADALKAEGASAAATDQDAAVFYHPNFVRRAKGALKMFVNPDRAEYYGTLMSALQRFGAAPARNDNKGIAVIIEDDGV